MYKLNASNYWFGELNFASSCSLLKVVTINQALNHSQRGSRSDRLKCYGTAASYFIFWHRHFFFNCQLNYAAAGLWGVSNYLLILKMVSLFVDTDWLIIVLVWLHCALRNCSKQVNHPVCLKWLCVNRSDVFSNKHWTDWVGTTWLWYVVPTPHPQWKYKDKGCVKRELITCKWNYLVFNLWRPPPPTQKKELMIATRSWTITASSLPLLIFNVFFLLIMRKDMLVHVKFYIWNILSNRIWCFR